MMNHISVTPITKFLPKSVSIQILNLRFLYKLASSSLQTLGEPNPSSLSNPLYNFLPPTQNPNNIVDLICSSLKQNDSEIILLKVEIQDILPHLGTREISRVLLRCQSDSSAALVFFNWVKNELGFKPDIRNYCLILHILTWSRKYPQTMKVLSELIRLNRGLVGPEDVFQNLVDCSEECSWEPVVFDMLLKAYLKAGMVREGLKTFRKMVKVGFVPSVISINFLLDGLLKSNCIDQCWEVYEEMGKAGVHANTHTFNILTCVLCRGRDVDKVNEFLEKMEEEGFIPDIVTYNTLLDNYCKNGKLKDALYLYKIMYIRHIIPDLVSHTILIYGFCKEGNVREAHKLFHRMVSIGLNPDIVSYNTLMWGYCKEGMMREARLLLQGMIGNKVSPDNFTCSMLVEGYEKQNALISSVNVVVELHRFGIPVSRDINAYLVLALCRESRPFAAKSLLERMSQDGQVPDLEIYNQLIDSFSNCNCLEEALQLKSEMVSKNIKPNLLTYRAVIGCLCRSNKSVEGELLMREMVEAGIIPDVTICRSMIIGLCNERNITRAESLLSFLAEEFKLFDTECYNALIRILGKEGNIDKLIELQDRLLKVGVAPNSLSFMYAIDGLSRKMGIEKLTLLEE